MGQLMRFPARHRFRHQTNHKITGREIPALEPESFAHAALDPVAIHRARQQAFGDYHSQPCLTDSIGPCHYQQTVCPGTFVFLENALEFIRFE